MNRKAWMIVAINAAVQMLLLVAMVMLTFGLGLISFAILMIGINLVLAAIFAVLALADRRRWPTALAFLISAGIAALLSEAGFLYLAAG